MVLISDRGPSQSQSAISPFWLNYWFRLPWFENELAIVVAVHAEVKEDLAGARDEDGGADDAPMHAGQEEQEHGKGWEGKPRVKVERCQERHRGGRRVLWGNSFMVYFKNCDYYLQPVDSPNSNTNRHNCEEQSPPQGCWSSWSNYFRQASLKSLQILTGNLQVMQFRLVARNQPDYWPVLGLTYWRPLQTLLGLSLDLTSWLSRSFTFQNVSEIWKRQIQVYNKSKHVLWSRGPSHYET